MPADAFTFTGWGPQRSKSVRLDAKWPGEATTPCISSSPWGRVMGVCRVSHLGCSSNKGSGVGQKAWGRNAGHDLSVCCVHRTDLPHGSITGASSPYP